jgi:thiamine biosynthesis lipoprotein
MGTAISIDVRSPLVAPEAIDRVFAYLRDVDARFSPFRHASEVNRLGRGEIALSSLSLDVRQVLALCEELRASTGGHFDARAHRGDGMLDAEGARNYAINAGGDVVLRGRPERGRRWRVGIQHPRQPHKVAAVLEIQDGAAATSGTYQRGSHIWQPSTGRPADEMLSLTVVGPSLTYADAYATAAFAMGQEGPAWVARQPGYGAFAVTCGDMAVWTPVAWQLRAP